MSSLRKKIRTLEKDIDARRALSAYKYEQIKFEWLNKLTSPIAFLTAFSAGFLITAHGKTENKPGQSESIVTKLLNGISKVSSALMLTQYIKNAYTNSVT